MRELENINEYIGQLQSISLGIGDNFSTEGSIILEVECESCTDHDLLCDALRLKWGGYGHDISVTDELTVKVVMA